jgi:hypothetical protein
MKCIVNTTIFIGRSQFVRYELTSLDVDLLNFTNLMEQIRAAGAKELLEVNPNFDPAIDQMNKKFA